MKVLDYVIWHHECRGGYGYVIKVPAQVTRINKRTVRISALCANGTVKFVNVDPRNLEPSTHDYYHSVLMAVLKGDRRG